MAKKALTIIELIFVVIIIGIMSAVATTMMRDDGLALATYQTLEHIRYTQHLAISDHKFDPKDNIYIYHQSGSDGTQTGKYYRSWWQIRFQNIPATNAADAIIGYNVYSDMDREGNIDRSTHKEAAANPLDGLRLDLYLDEQNNSQDVNLLRKYSISSIQLGGGCSVAGFTRVNNGNLGTIAFDEKGRPYYGIANNAQNNPYQYILTANCDITLTHTSGRQSIIRVYPETGYAEITRLD